MTTPCIGWPAPDTCPTYGDMHGCKHDDGHYGAHECDCGERHVRWRKHAKRRAA